jgi:hypothetical protein
VVLLLVLVGAAGVVFAGVEAGVEDAAGVEGVAGFEPVAGVEDDEVAVVDAVFGAGAGAGLLAVFEGVPYQVFNPL